MKVINTFIGKTNNGVWVTIFQTEYGYFLQSTNLSLIPSDEAIFMINNSKNNFPTF